MKKMKKLLACVLVLLTLGMLMLPAAAETETITEVKGRVVTPVIGTKISTLSAISAEPEKYTATPSVYFWKNGSAYHPTEDEVFLAGVRYYCRVTFTAKDGYRLDYSKLKCEIIGNESVSKVGSSTWEVLILAFTQEAADTYEATFASEQPDAPSEGTDADRANLCPYCGKEHTGLIQKIIGFFHQILFRLFGAKNK